MKVKLLILVVFIMLSSILSAVTFSGFVSDSGNGERLANVSVVIRGTDLGNYTNEEGYFVITNVPTGKIEIAFSKMGYKTNFQDVMVQSTSDDQFLKIELEQSAVKIEGISVTGDKYKLEVNSREITVSNVLRSTEDLRAVPQIADADVFRAIQVLPGVTSMSDFSSGLYIRGGSPDQNLILLDEIDVYNPNHFGGVFSTFNTDAVENVELLKGGFPAKYGGRLSSVLNVTNLDGNRKYHQGVARVSLISANSTLQGPWKIGNHKGSYMASFRRTYLELVDELISLNMPDYYFYDGHAKLNYDINEKDKVNLSTYFGKDRLMMNFAFDMLIEWGNETVSSQWVHIFSPQLFSKFTLAGSHFASVFDVTYSEDTQFTRTNGIYDGTLKSNFAYTPNRSHLIDFGLEAKYNNIKFIYETTGTDLDPDALPDVEVDSNIFAAFCQDSWDLGNFWTIQPGVRFTYCYNRSPNLPQSPVGKYFRISPRFSIRRKLSLSSNVYFNYGRYNQYLTSMNPGESTPLDIWFPIDGSVPPGKSDHYILGYKIQIGNDFGFDAEVYYKDYENLMEYNPLVDYEWSNATGKLSDAFNIGKGFSYGADIMLRTEWNGLEGFFGYSFGITKRDIENTNINPETEESEPYHPRYERVHQVNIVQNYRLSEVTGYKVLGSDLSIGTSYSFGSGQPYWEIEKYFTDPELNIEPIYSYNDKIRLPGYNRLDLSLRFKWQYEKWSLEPYIQVINVLDNFNVWFRDYQPEFAEDGTISTEEIDTGMFPRLPFIGFNMEF